MKVDVKEIAKITLKENEFLCITFDKDLHPQTMTDASDNIIKFFPEEWRNRVLFLTSNILMSKIGPEDKLEAGTIIIYPGTKH